MKVITMMEVEVSEMTSMTLICPCKNQVYFFNFLCYICVLCLLIFFSIFYFRMDEGRQPLSRKLPIPSSKINPYRIIIILRLVILGLFFHYRILHPVNDAYGLWLTSVICEIWFAVSWIMDQFPKWYPITRETYLDRLSLR
jgi:hypothetical protein